MVTYPSTHGVYETGIAQLCAKVHDAGGQVYVDGANLNALLGFAKPGRFGADVSHLNLHKTFCIPHGGGGPGRRAGRGPRAPGRRTCRATRCAVDGAAVGPVSAAPHGSAGILPIPWAYLRLMGPDGLARATGVAVLAANYVAARLREHFPVLYAGNKGLVAHECILDLRAITKASGVTRRRRGQAAGRLRLPRADDVVPGRRHAHGGADRVGGPDRAGPVLRRDDRDPAGDRRRWPPGEWPAADNPLANAPHTAEMVTADEWNHPYPRSVAAYPAGVDPTAKYWSPVRRIDGAYGDRNLVCSCPPPEAFES